ncbi:acriflavin resistance protein [Methylocella silvestris BL2]|uniref:Acriflavin resistance protein n=1 Tax=Methylocella silvestris (strain DSM 15510 / CIP 108128 / LMG 27833 / NCIMB 13906 / BL2) TaxID=395965 RepID=B8EN14_METSB|nr:efflux RND transporter permease subunit [Methylocella silvestris]ACK49149.1 acriflavin resistance protein [Methylocella silvestris BL2]
MNISAPFIRRPVATILIAAGIGLAGALGFLNLPVAPLPQVDFPTIAVSATLPGASPETVASSVASPLERSLGQIAAVTEMTSRSTIGQATITLQFDIDRDINGAARDVQGAINAARADLPTSLRSNPTYRKINPADAPILLLGLTSKTKTAGQIYDIATNILQPRLSQIEGVGQASLAGSALPAVRVEINPHALSKYGIGLEDVRAALAGANANSPKGSIEGDDRHFQIYTNDQANVAADYRNLVIAYRDGAPVRLSDVAEVLDSVEDLRNEGLINGKTGVLVVISPEPGANIIRTVDTIKAELTHLRAAMPADIDMIVTGDRSNTIRASVQDTEQTLLFSIALVTLIVFLFLRDWRSASVPAVVTPLSIIGAFGAMYLAGFSLNILSLMALTIATGFVVDDAIVVLENIARHIEEGARPLEAALAGAREVGFTVISISVSLIAVFIPILFMGGIIGRLFREFALTLTFAIIISLVLSLTLTPMMCALVLKARPVMARASRRFDPFAALQRGYGRTLGWALRHSGFVMLALFATICLNISLFTIIPKGFFPQVDTGRIMGSIVADQSISFQAMREKLRQLQDIVQRDPAVSSIVGFTGGSETNSGRCFINLKPRAQRDVSADEVIARLRGPLARVPGVTLYLQAVQDLRMGGRLANAQYQYTLQGDDANEIYRFAPKLVEALRNSRVIADINADQQQGGLASQIVIDRDAAARLGVTMNEISQTLYDAFGQRQVSTIFSAVNQYHVVMEVAPRYWQDPSILKDIYVSPAGGNPSGSAQSALPSGTVTSAANSSASASAQAADDSARNAATNAIASTGKSSASAGAAVSTSKEKMIPLAALAHFEPGKTSLNINHQGLFVASTLSFNLRPGFSLGQGITEINKASAQIGMPASIRGVPQGAAQAFQASLGNQGVLFLAALAAVYIVLGILYESFIHPITILSTLPSAGVGAVLALLAFHLEFSVIAMIGVILLIGIVKKNAIMMIDFALAAERSRGLSPRESIFEASMLRFRPIMMTTFAAILGAAPLALSAGEGAELRRPLGVAIVGGLIVSQMLTLYTTPVLYLYMDRFRLAAKGRWRRLFPRLATPSTDHAS